MTTFKKLSTVGQDLFHIFVAIYAVMLMLSSVFIPLKAQHPSPTITQESAVDIERRLDTIDRMNLDHRLTIIETTLTDMVSNFTWYRISSGGTGLLLAEAVFRHAKKRINTED